MFYRHKDTQTGESIITGVAKSRLANRMRLSSKSYAARSLICKNQNILIFFVYIYKNNVFIVFI